MALKKSLSIFIDPLAHTHSPHTHPTPAKHTEAHTPDDRRSGMAAKVSSDNANFIQRLCHYNPVLQPGPIAGQQTGRGAGRGSGDIGATGAEDMAIAGRGAMKMECKYVKKFTKNYETCTALRLMHTKLQIVAGTRRTQPPPDEARTQKEQRIRSWICSQIRRYSLGQEKGERRKVAHPKGKPRHAAFIASEAYLAHLMRRIMGNAIKCPLTWQSRSAGQHSGAQLASKTVKFKLYYN